MVENGKKTFEIGVSGVASCRALSHEILDMFVARLEEESAKSQSAPSLESIRALAEEIKPREPEELHRTFLDSAKICLRAHEREIWDQARRHPFDRVLVRRFSRLFPSEGDLDTGGRFLSRRMLPGFFLAFEKMASSQLYEQCQSACKRVVRARKEELGGDFDWQEIYVNEEIVEMTNDVFMVIASHFDDFHKRTEWLIELINSHLALPEDFAFEGEEVANWHMDEEGCLDLLRALFRPFEDRMSNDEGRRHIEHRYGHVAYKTVGNLLLELSIET